MEERSYTTQTDLSLNHALVRRISGGLSPLTAVYTQTAAAGAAIFCVAKKVIRYAALTLQSTLFSWLALNSLRSSNVFTSPKNNALCERDVEKVKPTQKQRVASPLISTDPQPGWKEAA